MGRSEMNRALAGSVAHSVNILIATAVRYDFGKLIVPAVKGMCTLVWVCWVMFLRQWMVMEWWVLHMWWRKREARSEKVEGLLKLDRSVTKLKLLYNVPSDLTGFHMTFDRRLEEVSTPVIVVVKGKWDRLVGHTASHSNVVPPDHGAGYSLESLNLLCFIPWRHALAAQERKILA